MNFYKTSFTKSKKIIIRNCERNIVRRCMQEITIYKKIKNSIIKKCEYNIIRKYMQEITIYKKVKNIIIRNCGDNIIEDKMQLSNNAICNFEEKCIKFTAIVMKKSHKKYFLKKFLKNFKKVLTFFISGVRIQKVRYGNEVKSTFKF